MPLKTLIDLTGQRFGSWTVVTRGADAVYSRGNFTRWLCRCDCGAVKNVRACHLRGGHSLGCHDCRPTGWYDQRTHGHSSRLHTSPTYFSWMAMLQRCTNPRATAWKNYGGRGIKVCERWRSFDNFLADMGERPEGKTLDRWPNPDGGYEPGNCQWSTPKEQSAHRRPRRATK